MKKLVYVFVAASLVACGSSKDAADGGMDSNNTEMSADPNRNDEAPKTQGRPQREGEVMNEAWATVHIKVEGCPIQLDVVEGDLFFEAYPVNLDHEYWKEGLKVKFSYQASKAPIPEACVVQKAIILKDVELKKD